MPVQGFSRYIRLFKNIQNPLPYFFDKIKRRDELIFITKPRALKIRVPRRLLLIFKEIFMSDVYDVDELIKGLSPDSVLLDIGANVGFFSALIVSKGPVKKIYAFEPIPVNIDTLKQIVADNKLLQEKIDLQGKAVTGKPMDGITLYLDSEKELTQNASVFSGFEKSHANKIIVESTTLSQIIIQNNLEQIDFMKMDCEGSEFDILYNTDPEHIRRIKKMMIEVHDVDEEKNNITYFNNYLQSLGYRTKYSPINNRFHVLTAERMVGANSN